MPQDRQVELKTRPMGGTLGIYRLRWTDLDSTASQPCKLESANIPNLTLTQTGREEPCTHSCPDCPMGSENPENCEHLWTLVTSGPGLTSAAVVLDLEPRLRPQAPHPHPSRLGLGLSLWLEQCQEESGRQEER